ncbi:MULTISPECIES: phosphate signaling complex protein PhoU [Methylomonas]|uniref:phosphate signaling complex protein PhoU n=1 Tax=Methylomonas TaxID=416 RepID=UPI001231F69C|nr:phosphate signaling complex protein PhoU [Methylomonas rhizoryzae]
MTQHTLKAFDAELKELHALIVEMVSLLVCQLEQTLAALDDGDMEMALKINADDAKVNSYEHLIDAQVINVLARHCPVADDLRTVISIAKISYELEKIGNEIADFARLVSVLFDPKTSDPNRNLLADIVKIAILVKKMLSKLLLAFDKAESEQAYLLLHYNHECEAELLAGIKHQLTYVMNDVRLIGRAMDIMHILKSLERCGEHSRNIAEYLIYMLEGVDVRHSGISYDME